jgi:malate dehydrogenase (oxaloacetate-decarboxylating)
LAVLARREQIVRKSGAAVAAGVSVRPGPVFAARSAVMSFDIRIDSARGQRYMVVHAKGRALLLDPVTNKGTAFTERERDELDLHGLVPPAVCTIQQQLERTYESFRAKPSDLERFIYLTALHDRNETLFYRLLLEHIDEMMPVVYTPVVGEACQRFSHIYRRGRGLYVGYEQRDRIEQILRAAAVEDPSVIVVTDGERILGLGDQGAGGMGIPIGKLCLYTLCAGVSPYSTIPVTLDVGTDNEERLADPVYLGERHRRVRGPEYQQLVDAFVAAVKRVFPRVVLQWEDFLKENALFQLARFRDQLCTFNDDIQGTAAVVVAGLWGALRIAGGRMRDQRVVFAGAGASAQGIAELVVSALCEDGLSREEALRRIWMTDSHGLVALGRPGLEAFKAGYARGAEEVATYAAKDRARVTLLETVENARPTVLIGTSATPGIFDEPVLRAMGRLQERPIVFPLSNPTSRSECAPEDALRFTGGRAIVATGSPFAPVSLDGRRHRFGQCNNSFVFPGVGLGLAVSRARYVSNGMFLEAARALAAQVTEADLAEGAVYPQLRHIRDCSHAVACATIRRAVEEGHADPDVLEHLEKRVERAMWYPEYLPMRYELPSASTSRDVDRRTAGRDGATRLSEMYAAEAEPAGAAPAGDRRR